MWSLTTPTFCMNAYTLVGPTKRLPLRLQLLGERLRLGGRLGQGRRLTGGARLRVIS